MPVKIVRVQMNGLTPIRNTIVEHHDTWSKKSKHYKNPRSKATKSKRRNSRTDYNRRSLWRAWPCCTSCCSSFLLILGCLIAAALILAVVLPICLISSTSTSTTQTAAILMENNNSTITDNITSTIGSTTSGSTSSSASTTIVTTTSTTANLTISTITIFSTSTSTSTSTTMSTSTSTSTSTTTTKTTSTSSTTSTTTANICMAGYTNSIQLLYLNMTSYLNLQYYQKNFTSPNVTSLTIMFSFRSDPTFWYLDNVVVSNSSGQQLLSNGNFEKGSLSGWVYCNPTNATNAGTVVSSYSYCYGYYCYRDGSVGAFDYLTQTFNAVP